MSEMEVIMTGSLTIKHDRWVMVLYGEYATFNPGKQSADPEKKSQKWISTGLPATTRNRAVANRMMFETIKKLLAGDMDGTFVSPFNDDSADSSETISEESNTGELFHTEKEKAAG